MKVWQARKAAPRRGDYGGFMCGRMVAGAYVCHTRIATVALWSADESEPSADAIWLPVGLTDEGTPGAFRWSSRARDKRARNRSVSVRSGPNVRRIEWTQLPISLPCPQGHENNIDRGLL